MIDIRQLLRDAQQVIIKGQLHYYLNGRQLRALQELAASDPALEKALSEAQPEEGHPASLYMIPADQLEKLINPSDG